MLTLQSGDRVELFYEDAPGTTIRATVGRLLTDRDEGMGPEVEDYSAGWIEITVDEPSDIDAKQEFDDSNNRCRVRAGCLLVVQEKDQP